MPIIFDNHIKTTLEDAINEKETEATTYVDDTTINIYKQDDKTLQQSLDDTLYTLKQYMNANKLVMNDDKTKFMIISKHREKYRDVRIKAEPNEETLTT